MRARLRLIACVGHTKTVAFLFAFSTLRLLTCQYRQTSFLRYSNARAILTVFVSALYHCIVHVKSQLRFHLRFRLHHTAEQKNIHHCYTGFEVMF